jgi:hypothetical protein
MAMAHKHIACASWWCISTAALRGALVISLYMAAGLGTGSRRNANNGYGSMGTAVVAARAGRQAMRATRAVRRRTTAARRARVACERQRHPYRGSSTGGHGGRWSLHWEQRLIWEPHKSFSCRFRRTLLAKDNYIEPKLPN